KLAAHYIDHKISCVSSWEKLHRTSARHPSIATACSVCLRRFSRRTAANRAARTDYSTRENGRGCHFQACGGKKNSKPHIFTRIPPSFRSKWTPEKAIS